MARPEGFEPPTTWFVVRWASFQAFRINNLTAGACCNLPHSARPRTTDPHKIPANTWCPGRVRRPGLHQVVGILTMWRSLLGQFGEEPRASTRPRVVFCSEALTSMIDVGRWGVSEPATTPLNFGPTFSKRASCAPPTRRACSSFRNCPATGPCPSSHRQCASMLRGLVWDVGVAGSNPVIPTN